MRQRSFDYDEARALHAKGWSYVAIARKLGVSDTAVTRAVDGEVRARMDRRTSEWQKSGVCPDCGEPATRHSGGQQHRCKQCAFERMVKRDEHGRLYCPSCDEWKDESEFTPRPSLKLRGFGSECRACETRRRRANRHANRERERLYARLRRRAMAARS